MTTYLELVEQDNLRMYAAIQRVRELHKQGTSMFNDNIQICTWCSSICEHEQGTIVYFPCLTVQVLDGEQ